MCDNSLIVSAVRGEEDTDLPQTKPFAGKEQLWRSPHLHYSDRIIPKGSRRVGRLFVTAGASSVSIEEKDCG